MRHLILLLIIIQAILLSSCNENEKFTYTSSLSFKDVFSMAGNEHKGVILLLGSNGCNICDFFLTDVNNDEKFKSEIGKEYIVARINRDTKDAQWIFELLERSSYPTFLVFDKKQQLKGYFGGYPNKEEFRLILNEIKTNGYYINETNLKLLTYPTTKETLIESFGGVFKSKLLIADKNQPEQATQIEKLLTRSLELYPSIYTRYLLADFYHGQNDSIKMKELARQALDSCNKYRDHITYIPLRGNLYKLLDKNYNFRDNAFFEENKEKSNIGEIEVGKVAKISIPFVNGGKKDLKLIKVSGDCSCTNVSYPERIIQPSEKGEILVSIIPEQKGNFQRAITIISTGINSPYFIYITGTAK